MSPPKNVEEAAKAEMEFVAMGFDAESDLMASATLYGRKPTEGKTAEDGPFLTLLAMPGLSDMQQRLAVRKAAVETDGYLVSLHQEVWGAAFESTDDPVKIALIQAASASGNLHELPDELKIEAVVLYAESETEPIRQWRALISRASGKRVLGSWLEAKVTLPRPSFKRYLVEKR